jgi:hypothetical protein
MAGFHFGEISRDEWERMPSAARFGWYYDKTHALIDEYKELFSESITVVTENLSEEPTRRAIARIVVGSDAVVPPPTRLHAYSFDVGSLPEDYREKAMWLVGQVDWERLVTDESYAIFHFLRKFLEWQDPQAKGLAALGTQRSRDEVAATLAQVRAKLTEAVEHIAALEFSNRRRDG